MDDNFGKHFRLFGTLFFTFIGFLVSLALLFLAVKLFFGVLSYVPMLSYLYMILIIMFPTVLFVTVYIIYLKRTVHHPSKPVRLISYAFFIAALLCWIGFFILDVKLFFTHLFKTIDRYHTYNLLFLSLNVACIFFIGVLQALSTAKEKDWMERSINKQ